MSISSELSDEELVVAIRTKDQELYVELIERYELKLSKYLRKYIFNAEDLNDLLQEVFIKAFKNLNGFDVKRSFSAWIYRVAHNEAVNFLRKKKIQQISLDEVEFQLFDSNQDFAKDFDKNLDKIALENALSKLSIKYLEPLVLHYFEDKSYEEISDILRIPINSVGTLIFRAKKNLKQKIYE